MVPQTEEEAALLAQHQEQYHAMLNGQQIIDPNTGA